MLKSLRSLTNAARNLSLVAASAGMSSSRARYTCPELHEFCGLQVCIDSSKVMPFLLSSSEKFEQILDAEDAQDGATIEHVLSEMEEAESAEIVQQMLSQLYTNHEQHSVNVQ